MEPERLSEDAAAGRRRRAKILVAVAFAVLLPASAYDWYAGRRAEERAGDLVVELRAELDDVDVQELALAERMAWSDPRAGGPSPLEALLGDAETLSFRGFDERGLRAKVRVGWGGTDRCVHLVIRPDADRAVVDGPLGC